MTEVNDHRVIYCFAYCDICQFNVAFLTEETYYTSDVAKAACEHISETGHAVCIEKGMTVNYDIRKVT